MEDYYEVLGIARAAGDADIRQAYKRAALRWHPDKNPDDRAKAEATFKKVAEAYRVLTDPRTRRAHDSGLDAAAAAARPAEVTAPSSWSSSLRRAAAAAVAVPATAWLRSPPPPPPVDAYSLFEEVLGKDPFKEFDGLFTEPSAQNIDRFFKDTLNCKSVSSSASAGNGTYTRSVTRTTGAGNGFITINESRCAERSSAPPSLSRAATGPLLANGNPTGHECNATAPTQVLPISSGAVRVRCLAANGVAYRRTPNLADRVQDARGPNWGDVLLIQARQGDWVRCALGWLPVSADGQALFEVLDGSRVLSARCLAANGVAYRASMDFNNRLAGIRGPNRGDVVAFEERIGIWLRCRDGWLPLTIGGEQVFELLEVTRASEAPRPARAGPSTAPAPTTGASPWTGWSLLPAAWPYGLLTVLGTGFYVAARTSSILLRASFRLSYGWLPRLW